MSQNIEQNQIMTIADLKQILTELAKELCNDYEVRLSNEEEGKKFLPMLKDTKLCLAIEKDEKKIIFFPSH